LGTKADYAEYLQKRTKMKCVFSGRRWEKWEGEIEKGAINGSAQI